MCVEPARTGTLFWACLMRSEWQQTAAGKHLRGRTTKDTLPERVLRQELHRRGLRFRLHVRVCGRATVDILLPRHKVAVLVDGCFWHSCPAHGPQPGELRGPNAELWKRKLDTTRERDRRTSRELSDSGWRVVRVWECEIRTDTGHAADRVERLTRTDPDGLSNSAR